jgi:hypothetical protein
MEPGAGGGPCTEPRRGSPPHSSRECHGQAASSRSARITDGLHTASFSNWDSAIATYDQLDPARIFENDFLTGFLS